MMEVCAGQTMWPEDMTFELAKAQVSAASGVPPSSNFGLNADRQDEILKLSMVWLKLEAARIAVRLLELTAILIMAAGSIGELLAVYALHQGHDQPGVRLTVLLSGLAQRSTATRTALQQSRRLAASEEQQLLKAAFPDASRGSRLQIATPVVICGYRSGHGRRA
jgi:hypothetical protein